MRQSPKAQKVKVLFRGRASLTLIVPQKGETAMLLKDVSEGDVTLQLYSKVSSLPDNGQKCSMEAAVAVD